MKTTLYSLVCFAVLSVLLSSGCVTAARSRDDVYTGVIINTKNLRFSECDKPRIYSETGEEILPTVAERRSEPGVIPKSPLAEYIVYGTDLNHELTHTDAAERPLVLYPVQTSWKSESCSIVLDTHSADTLKDLDRKLHLFETNRVVLLINAMTRDWTSNLPGGSSTARSYDEFSVKGWGIDTSAKDTCQTDAAKLASLIVALRNYVEASAFMNGISGSRSWHANTYTRQVAKKYMKYWNLFHDEGTFIQQRGTFEDDTTQTFHFPLFSIKSKLRLKDFDVVRDEIELHTVTETFSVTDYAMSSYGSGTTTALYILESLLRFMGMTASYNSLEDCKTECTLKIKLSTRLFPGDSYSGIIIDARGRNIQPAMRPSIYNEAGHKIVDFAIVLHTEGGDEVSIFPGYGKDLYGKSFIGKPEQLLVIKALAKGPRPGDVVISNQDASLLRRMNEHIDYFQLGLVRIILD